MDETPSRQKKLDPENPEKISGNGASKRRVATSRLKRRLLKHIWLVRIGLVALGVLGVYLLFVVFGFVLTKTPVGYYGVFLVDFVFTPQDKIELISGRTNVLILGKGGVGHEAPDLTDTIIFASISHEDPSVTLISLPRDIWIPALRAKLNSTYYWGNQKQEGGGLILAKSTVEEIIGQPVHYGVVIDFSGFKRIVDTLGGIEVDVERSFTDKRYPIPGREDDECGGDDPDYLCRYETIQFEKGSQLMDGETALKFARSRNAEGDEGTDFARAARQEKVLATIKNKALSRKILLNPKKLLEIVRVVQESVETDMGGSAAAILARRMVSAKDNTYTHVLSEDFLIRPPISRRYDNLYVFITRDETWGEIHEWVECVLENGDCD
jgi:LCP family protein required for cell wall assembly